MTVRKIEINWAELAELVEPVVAETAASIAARAGEGFEWDIRMGTRGRVVRPRPHAVVRAVTPGAVRRHRRDNVLLKAMGGGGVS